jgi:hypothetical protein
MFLNSKEAKRFGPEWEQAFPKFNLFLTSMSMQFWSVILRPKYPNSGTFSKNVLAISILWFYPAFWWQDMKICCIHYTIIINLYPSHAPLTFTRITNAKMIIWGWFNTGTIWRWHHCLKKSFKNMPIKFSFKMFEEPITLKLANMVTNNIVAVW